MKKIILATSLLVMGSTSVMAAKIGETGVGIEYGKLNSDAVSRLNTVESDGDLSTTYEALRAGKYYDFGRIGVAVGKMNKDKGTDGTYLGVNYDYMFYNQSKLVPFIGASASYSWNEWSGSNISVEHNGFQYGPEAGVVYEISDKVDIEAGARYLSSNVKGDTTVSGNKLEIEVNSVVQYYVSVGYKF